MNGSGALAPVGGPTDVLDHQAVETPFVVSERQELAEALDEALFVVGRDGHLAPDFDGAGFGFFGVAECEVGGGEGCVADAVFRFGVFEVALDRRGATAFGEDQFLEALIEDVAFGPGGVFGEEGFVFADLAVAAAQAIPVHQFEADGVFDGAAEFKGLGDVAGVDGLDAVANAGGLVNREVIAADGGDGCVEGFEMVAFAGGREAICGNGWADRLGDYQGAGRCESCQGQPRSARAQAGADLRGAGQPPKVQGHFQGILDG